MTMPRNPLTLLPIDPSAGRPLDVRSRFVIGASWVGFGISVAWGLIPFCIRPDDGSKGVFGLVIWPLISWYWVRPFVGRIASGLGAFFLPIYRAVVWKPERYRAVYGKPLPTLLKERTPDFRQRESTI